jgi:hypothetical protein
MKVIRSSALNTGHLYPQEIFLVLISVRDWVDPQGHSAAGRIRAMKYSSDTIGNRTRDFTAGDAVPQPTAPPRACIFSVILQYNINTCLAHIVGWALWTVTDGPYYSKFVSCGNYGVVEINDSWDWHEQILNTDKGFCIDCLIRLFVCWHWSNRYTVVRIRWHMRRNQISSFGETDESTWLGGAGATVQSTTGSRGVRVSC